MKKHLIVYGIFLFILIVGFSGCTNNSLDTEKNKFIGTWMTDDLPDEGLNIYRLYGINTLDFFSDNTYIGKGGISGSYEIKNDKLVMTFPYYTFAFDYSFLNNDNTLILIDDNGLSATYEKS